MSLEDSNKPTQKEKEPETKNKKTDMEPNPPPPFMPPPIGAGKRNGKATRYGREQTLSTKAGQFACADRIVDCYCRGYFRLT